MKYTVLVIGLMTSTIIATDQMLLDAKHHQTSWHIEYPYEDHQYLDFEAHDVDFLIKRVGVKALIEQAIRKIEHLKTDQTTLVKSIMSSG